MSDANITKIGAGVMIFKSGKILLGHRKSKYGDGEYAFPGGRLEYAESFEECARREIAEESGIEIENIRFQFLANIKKYAPEHHYIYVGLIADWKHGEPQSLEPDKNIEWKWYDLKELPKPLFITSQLAVKSHSNGTNYYDSEE